MSTITVRLNPEEKEVFNSYAKLMGKPLSTLLKEALMEKLEDEYDLRIAEEFEKQYQEGKVTVRPIEEFFKELID